MIDRAYIEAFGYGYGFGAGYLYGLRLLKTLAKDEAEWITVHPNGGNGEGRPCLIDSETGQILGGMGGQHTGKTISEVKQETEANREAKKDTQASISEGDTNNANPNANQPATPKTYKNRSDMTEAEKQADDSLVTKDATTGNISASLNNGTLSRDFANNYYTINTPSGELQLYGISDNLSNAEIIDKANDFQAEAEKQRQAGNFDKWQRQQFLDQTGYSDKVYPQELPTINDKGSSEHPTVKWDMPKNDDSVRPTINPNYEADSKAYGQNCQTCVTAHEMARRGYNVEAVERNEANLEQNRIREFGRTQTQWVDKNGMPISTETQSNTAKTAGARALKQYNWMNEKVGKNQRFHYVFIDIDPVNGRAGGHTVVIEKDNKGVLKWIDPQSNEVFDKPETIKKKMRNHYYNTMAGKNPYMYRVDDKQLKEESAKYLLRARDKGN